MPQWPDAPRHIRPLNDNQLARLVSDDPTRSFPKNLMGCPTCKGTESFRWYADETRTEVIEWECNCAEQIKLFYYLSAAGVPYGFQRMSWADADALEPGAQAFLDDYRDNLDGYVASGLGLFLFGRHGTGKSMVGYLLIKDLIRRRKDCYAITQAQFLKRHKETWGGGERAREDYGWFESRIRQVPFLLADELGRETGRGEQGRAEQRTNSFQMDASEVALDDVLRYRVAADLPSILTSNRSKAEFRQLYSSGAAELLVESCLDYEFTAESYRDSAKTRTVAEAKQLITRPVML